jgi:hypothetical protein
MLTVVESPSVALSIAHSSLGNNQVELRVPADGQQRPKIQGSGLVWIALMILATLLALSLVADLSGKSSADRFLLYRWSVDGLRIYLWLEGATVAALVAGFGAHIISGGLTVTRGASARFAGITLSARRAVSPLVGWVFVILGAELVALSFTMLVLLNSCRYMRII